MKNIFIFFILILSINIVYCQPLNTLTEINNFGKNTGNLNMYIYNNLPVDSVKKPLVVVLHGCGENAKRAAELTGWNKLADINDFVVLYPEQKFWNNPNLCFNWFNNNDIEKNKGECESIFQMVKYAIKNYSIDNNKIYITGLSAGAAMSVVMVSTYPELFQSGAIFAGCAYKMATNPIDGIKVMLGKKDRDQSQLIMDLKKQNPDYIGSYPSLIIYQGTNDPVVKSENVRYLISQWAGINKADTIPDKIETHFMGNDDITRKEYTDSLGNIKVLYYEVGNLGHRLMVKPGDKEDEGGKLGLFGVDKNFHSTYQTAKDFGILKTPH